MTNFIKLRCVAINGAEAPLYDGHGDYPYGSNWYTDDTARAVRQSRVTTIKWECNNVQHKLEFDYIVSAVLEPISDLLIVTLHYGDRVYTRPRNGVVVNADGTINHQITPPTYVEIQPPHSQVGRHLIESIHSVSIQNGEALIGLEFCYEWVEERYYNAADKKWGSRVQIYRK